MEPLSLHRHVELDVTVEQLWELVSEPARLAEWLGDSVELDVRNDGGGTIVDEGVRKLVHIERVEAGQGLSFSWWEADQPARGTRVEFEIAALPDGGSRLDITETFSPEKVSQETISGAVAGASASVAAARQRWEARVCLLWACTVVAALVA